MLWVVPAAIVVAAYLLGSIPFGLVLTRFAGGGDIRAIGSGNIGATNVLRSGRKGLAALTLLLDAAKGTLAVLGAMAIDPGYGAMAGFAAFVGHCYPVWLGFRGGKGVATALGVLIVLSWPVVAIAAAVWAILLVLSRIVSLSSIAAAVTAPIAAIVMGDIALVPLVLSLSVIIVRKHHANISRLLAGSEPRLGQRAA